MRQPGKRAVAVQRQGGNGDVCVMGETPDISGGHEGTPGQNYQPWNHLGDFECLSGQDAGGLYGVPQQLL